MPSGRAIRPITERVETFLNNIIIDNECWIWTKNKDQCGYGNFCFNSKQIKAHRFSFIIFKGEIKKGNLILHSCDNPSCVNPNHLSQGTSRDNVRDSMNKGRFKRWTRENNKCRNGHDISDPINLYTYPSSGYTSCRICMKALEEKRRRNRNE
jgi:hypothetical protein